MKRIYKNIFLIITVLTGVLTASTACNKEVAQPGGDFEYREIYLPDPRGENAASLGLNNLDNDWAIWGHNLAGVLPKNPSSTVYATIRGNTEYEQFCFSSDRLFEYICEYIDDNYRLNKGKRFAILPQDNSLVCECDLCVAAGNTAKDASPAVFNMIRRLAEKYPEHQFFTSHYLTTKSLPEEKLPENVGVLISAMDYPLTTAPTADEESFRRLIESWAGKTDKVYVWDYINNFDDYFTPLPILAVMDRRFNLYREAGVAGVFLNGSGTDYSTFSDIKKKVMAEMLQDTDIDWKSRVREVSRQYYPTVGDIIADYIISQEELVERNGARLPMYEGIKVASATYLDEQPFIDFYHALEDAAPSLSGQEKADIDRLLGVLSYTRLELMRKNGDISRADKHLRRLKAVNSDIQVYNEACWPLEKYIHQYNYLKSHNEAAGNESLIKGKKLIPRTKLDEDYTDVSILTDGVLGIPSNYHSGNLLYSSPVLDIEIPQTEGIGGVRVWLVRNRAYKIFLPEEVSLRVGDRLIGKVVPPEPENNSGHSIAEFDIPEGLTGPIVLSIKKNPEAKTMAVDEIEAYP